jgi:rod shape-determining protein MreD
MIMPRGTDQLLLPVNPLFMWITLLVALLLNLVPLGRQPAMPDFLALALVFWNVHQPRRVGVGVAFVLGVLMDVHAGALLGYFAIAMHRRLLWFSVLEQALQVLPLFAAAHLVALLVRLASGGAFPGWALLAAPALESLLWPIAAWFLLAPQRRAPDPDENRPL